MCLEIKDFCAKYIMLSKYVLKMRSQLKCSRLLTTSDWKCNPYKCLMFLKFSDPVYIYPNSKQVNVY